MMIISSVREKNWKIMFNTYPAKKMTINASRNNHFRVILLAGNNFFIFLIITRLYKKKIMPPTEKIKFK